MHSEAFRQRLRALLIRETERQLATHLETDELMAEVKASDLGETTINRIIREEHGRMRAAMARLNGQPE
ncbi:hypothetical protein [Palleronia caenipelagi]|uniref:Uncharacterized protein n=1 Tax=Palleronia caenipelagi TaxID=2489174 RepID=A0A547PWC0_9RHOB|nr:hypothetical protein [Palleronia caenipelagi]TRD18374.1 hypothetical protein FEV53_12010 [Palleronia caenipelagi]